MRLLLWLLNLEWLPGELKRVDRQRRWLWAFRIGRVALSTALLAVMGILLWRALPMEIKAWAGLVIVLVLSIVWAAMYFGNLLHWCDEDEDWEAKEKEEPHV